MEEKREKDLKDLSQLIVSALTNDEAVMSALSDLKKRKVIEPTTLLGLALKINDLLEISGSTLSEKGGDQELEKYLRITEERKPEADLKLKPAVKSRSVIDGRQLTQDEMLFEEWAIANFNEREWLKKTGLVW